MRAVFEHAGPSAGSRENVLGRAAPRAPRCPRSSRRRSAAPTRRSRRWPRCAERAIAPAAPASSTRSRPHRSFRRSCGPTARARRSCASCGRASRGSPPSTRSTGSGCWRGCCRRGPTCAAVRNAIPTTASRSTRISPGRSAEMGRLLDDDASRRPVDGRRARAGSPIGTALLLGALLHDIGKIGEGGHVPVGARIATETLEHMGVRGATRDLAAFMVGQHLLLPDTATRRDLTDEDLILDVAATHRLARATRPRSTLLATADAARDRARGMDPVAADARARARGAGCSACSTAGTWGPSSPSDSPTGSTPCGTCSTAEPDDAVERFVLRHAARLLPVGGAGAGIAAHYPTIAPDVGSTEVRAPHVDRARSPSTYELLVVAADRPGLLSWIAGAVALAGLSILSAQAFTTDDGVAVDVFEVEGVVRARDRRGAVARVPWRACARPWRGALSLEHRVAEKRARYPAPRSPDARSRSSSTTRRRTTRP